MGGVQTEIYLPLEPNFQPLLKKPITVVNLNAEAEKYKSEKIGYDIEGNVYSRTIEGFVDQQQTISITETVLVGISLMVGAALIAVLFIWSFQSGGSALFIVVYSSIVLAFAIEMVILLVAKRDVLSPMIFQFYLGSIVAVGLLALAFMIIFGVKYNRRSSYSAQSIPSAPPASY
jgi:CHASE2 domain-containing sensor protein